MPFIKIIKPIIPGVALMYLASYPFFQHRYFVGNTVNLGGLVLASTGIAAVIF